MIEQDSPSRRLAENLSPVTVAVPPRYGAARHARLPKPAISAVKSRFQIPDLD